MALFITFLLFSSAYCYNIDAENAIVYTLPSVGRLNYFGMTVAIRPHAAFNNKTWAIQIGAPRSNVSGISVKEPGTVYRCRVTGPCALELLSKQGNEYENSRRKLATTRRDYGWVGVAMDINDIDGKEMSMTCGHRMSYQLLWQPLGIPTKPYLLTGGCYFENIPSTDPPRLVRPLNDDNRVYEQTSRTEATFNWGQGLSGMSASFTSRASIMGAPHVWFMTGTVLTQPLDFGPPRVGNISTSSFIKNDYYAYNGYSVGSGMFFGDKKEWFVFGAPRSGGLHGRVFMFLFKKGSFQEMEVHDDWKNGETYGEYFGASLDVGDINDDGYDDLIVGAPMFSRSYAEQGRVYVFLGGKASFTLPLQGAVLDGSAEQGRFGTSLRVGHLDQDRYQDLIVGAPGEGGHGTIYVYRGGPRGLSPTQIIHGTDISASIKGFGISISRPVDVDGNNYLDVAIGAYLSDQAVLLRTRPVIELVPAIQHPPLLDRKQSSFQITVCLSYFGQFPPAFCYVDVELIVDEEFDRGYLRNGTNMWFLENVKTNYKNPKCHNLTLDLEVKKLAGTFENALKLDIVMSLHNAEKEPSVQSLWNKSGILHPVYPVHKVDSKTWKKIVEIPFAGDCGTDNLCQANLTLSCDMIDIIKGKFVIGSREGVTLSVVVRNTGELALLISLYLTIKGAPVFYLEPSDSGCFRSRDYVYCDVPSLNEGAEERLTFKLMTDLWEDMDAKQVHFIIRANTSSHETECEMNLDLISDAQIDLISSPTKTLSLTEYIPPNLNLSFVYAVQKMGHSPVNDVILKISFPSSLKDSEEAFAVVAVNNDEIRPEASEVDVTLENEVNAEKELSPRLNIDENVNKDVLKPRRISLEKILYMNCSNTNFSCFTVSRSVPAVSSYVFDLTIVLNMTKLDLLFNDFDVIHFVTNGSVEAQIFLQGNVIVNKTASVIIVKPPVVKEIDSRIILLSAVAGGIILAFMIPILIREGFFRRKTKEQMEALKAEDFIKERFSMYGPPPSEGDVQQSASNRFSGLSANTIEGANSPLNEYPPPVSTR